MHFRVRLFGAGIEHILHLSKHDKSQQGIIMAVRTRPIGEPVAEEATEARQKGGVHSDGGTHEQHVQAGEQSHKNRE